MNADYISQISRRQFLASAGLTAAAIWLAPRRVFAAEEGPVQTIRAAAGPAKITVQRIRDNISVIEGSGGNVAVLTGSDGKLLVDAGITASREGITEALASIDSRPVQTLVNTHWHFDHTDGNEWLHSIGAEITAQENTLKRLSVDTRVDGWHFTFPASPKGALPTTTFSKEHSIKVNGTTLELEYYGPCHTDSDISVYFTDADVIHVADSWWNGHYPFIDYSTGGSIDGQIQAANANVARVSDNTVVIPGHGPVGNRAQLIEFRDMLVDVRDAVASLKHQGKTLHDVIAAKPTAAYDAKWGSWVISPKAFTTLVYAGV
jgi:glyoxylase-like metal-dependent hydrolase (beta-lactamase superfamily II)